MPVLFPKLLIPAVGLLNCSAGQQGGQQGVCRRVLQVKDAGGPAASGHIVQGGRGSLQVILEGQAGNTCY